MTKQKRPRQKVRPSRGKQPRGGKPDKYNAEKEQVSWHFGILDPDGPWGCRKIDAATLWDTLHNRLKGFETMKWAELPTSGSHQVALSKIEKPAIDRLQEINQDDVDSLYSLRIHGAGRVWGIRDRHILKLLWWDPNHEVCPSLKKHT